MKEIRRGKARLRWRGVGRIQSSPVKEREFGFFLTNLVEVSGTATMSKLPMTAVVYPVSLLVIQRVCFKTLA